MRVAVVAALLLLVATARRGAAAEGAEGAEEPAGTGDFLSRHLQSFSDLFTRELPQRLRADELRSQAEQYLERANKQLEPLARELRSNVLGLFSSLLQLGKTDGQGGNP
ncbi:apolipoprotein A-II-like [Chamaea fasciata]|uniref:apolipoprotein A-II-like n=1 Tax=Chamaea fasciata TaxID=190680 RepID=UPI00336A3788